jgi:hypothetical protein
MKTWEVVTPGEHLRDAKPLDAAECAARLDHVRGGRALAIDQDPAESYERTLRAKGPAVECRGAARSLPSPTHPPRR